MPKPEPKPKAEPKMRPEPIPIVQKPKPKSHGIDIIDNKDRKWWEKQNITVLKQQAELRGHRFDELETTGVLREKNKSCYQKR